MKKLKRLGSDMEVLKAQIADVKSGLSIDDELTVKESVLALLDDVSGQENRLYDLMVWAMSQGYRSRVESVDTECLNDILRSKKAIKSDEPTTAKPDQLAVG